MSQVYAKIKSRGKETKYRVFLNTADDVFESKDVIVKGTVPYDPATNIDEGEWFEIDDFSKSDYTIDLITERFDSLDFPALRTSEFNQIDFIFLRSYDTLMFQNIGKSKLIRKKGFLRMGNGFLYSGDYSAISIGDYPDAIYDSKNDCLMFRSLSAITGIFNGISNLFREATSEEIKEFLEQDFISLGTGFTSEYVKTPNRKRIALAKQTLNTMTSKDKKRVFSYIFEYCPKLKTDDEAFCVNSDEELTLLLYGIEQRFYTTPVGKERRIANSVIKMDTQ